MIRSKSQNLKTTQAVILASLFIVGLLGVTVVKTVTAANTKLPPPSGSFVFTGELNTARYDHSATLLPNGEVLVAGGLGVNGIYNPLASAELYDPAANKWTPTNSMAEGRVAFTATLLPNGDVLIAGGSGYTASCFATAELYRPSTGQWMPTGTMTQRRCYHSATLLPNGEVLVAGGVASLFELPDTTATAELYDPSTGMWRPTGSLKVGRALQAAILENGQALAAGGFQTLNGSTTYLASAELYEPSTGLWTPTASMRLATSNPTTPALLPNSGVLIGDEAQFYNPTAASWVSTGALPKVAGPPSQASALQNGNVLASGTRCAYSGCADVATTACFLYLSATNSWSVTNGMNQARLGHSSTLLVNGKVLLAGGYSGNLTDPTILKSAELYTP